MAFSARASWARIATPIAGSALLTHQMLVAYRQPLHCEEQQQKTTKLPIYSAPPEPITIAEVRGPLEDQVASARTYVSNATESGRNALREQVDRWIGVERAVETRVSSLIAKDEELTPGILYVGVATLAGSVFTRYRSFPIRFLTPPLFLVGSLNYFLPKTTHNLSQYYLEVEQRRLPPVVRQQREHLLRFWQQSKGAAKDNFEKAKQGTGDLVHKGLQSVEQGTGLKVGAPQASSSSTSTEGKKLNLGAVYEKMQGMDANGRS